jgi:hypothetical protein
MKFPKNLDIGELMLRFIALGRYGLFQLLLAQRRILENSQLNLKNLKGARK